MSELRALRCRQAQWMRAASLTAVRQDGLSLPPLLFHAGGLPELIKSLKKVRMPIVVVNGLSLGHVGLGTSSGQDGQEQQDAWEAPLTLSILITVIGCAAGTPSLCSSLTP